jgi:hypothetical protein
MMPLLVEISVCTMKSDQPASIRPSPRQGVGLPPPKALNFELDTLTTIHLATGKLAAILENGLLA